MSRFTQSASLADEELEARLRATLRRHADEIEPTQPPWSELVAQAGAVVLPLHGTELPPAHLRSRRSPHFTGPWVRPVLAAAVALCIAMAGALIVQRTDRGEAPSSPDETDTVSDAKLDGPVHAPPGSYEFDRPGATPLPLRGQLDEVGEVNHDPELLGKAFLYDAGLGENGERLIVGPDPAFDPVTTGMGEVQTATLWWSVQDEYGAPIADGPVIMRQEEDGLWTVIGAYTSRLTVGVNGVQRAEGLIAFTVTDSITDPTVRVMLNGVEIDLATLGGGGAKRYLETDLAPDQVTVIEVQHMIGDVPASITSMALPPVGSDPGWGAPQSTTTAPTTPFTPGR